MKPEIVKPTADPALQLPIFAGLDAPSAALVLQHLQRVGVRAGQVIFEQESPGDDLYVIESGQVQVIRQLENGMENALAVLAAGEIFGEMALLEECPRSARVVAYSDVTLLSISRRTFDRLIEESPTVAVHLLKRVSARLRERNEHQEVLLNEKLQLIDELATKNRPRSPDRPLGLHKPPRKLSGSTPGQSHQVWAKIFNK